MALKFTLDYSSFPKDIIRAKQTVLMKNTLGFLGVKRMQILKYDLRRGLKRCANVHVVLEVTRVKMSDSNFKWLQILLRVIKGHL